MDIKIVPSTLKGDIKIPSSKSVTHRMLISAGLSDGISHISGVSLSVDIKATISALTAIGASFRIDGDEITIRGISKIPEYADINCHESGSTLRFIIPIVSALGISASISGEGRLPQRPITPYLRELSSKNVTFDYQNTMPFSVSGTLRSGTFRLEGDISSQFVTGLMFALPLLNGDSEIVMTSPLQSKPYADMTVKCLRKFGIKISETQNGYFIKGNQRYIPCDTSIEGDYSQGAFFFVANAVGNNVNILNLCKNSMQGDEKIVEILSDIGYNKKSDVKQQSLSGFNVNATDIPDLVPILAVLGCFCNSTSVIMGAERLKIKESDRLEAISSVLNTLGGNISVTSDGLVIQPVKTLHGGIVDSFNDHRIVMAVAIASTRSNGDIIIKNAGAVRKSYPLFFDDYNNIGGNAHVINLEQ